MLDVEMDRQGDATILRPEGDVDLGTSRDLQLALKSALEERPGRVVVDLTKVPYMDSSGVATLVEAMQIARKQSTALVLCAMQDKVRSIFEIARLDRVFTIVPSMEEALAT